MAKRNKTVLGADGTVTIVRDGLVWHDVVPYEPKFVPPSDTHLTYTSDGVHYFATRAALRHWQRVNGMLPTAASRRERMRAAALAASAAGERFVAEEFADRLDPYAAFEGRGPGCEECSPGVAAWLCEQCDELLCPKCDQLCHIVLPESAHERFPFPRPVDVTAGEGDESVALPSLFDAGRCVPAAAGSGGAAEAGAAGSLAVAAADTGVLVPAADSPVGAAALDDGAAAAACAAAPEPPRAPAGAAMMTASAHPLERSVDELEKFQLPSPVGVLAVPSRVAVTRSGPRFAFNDKVMIFSLERSAGAAFVLARVTAMDQGRRGRNGSRFYRVAWDDTSGGGAKVHRTELVDEEAMEFEDEHQRRRMYEAITCMMRSGLRRGFDVWAAFARRAARYASESASAVEVQRVYRGHALRGRMDEFRRADAVEKERAAAAAVRVEREGRMVARRAQRAAAALTSGVSVDGITFFATLAELEAHLERYRRAARVMTAALLRALQNEVVAYFFTWRAFVASDRARERADADHLLPGQSKAAQEAALREEARQFLADHPSARGAAPTPFVLTIASEVVPSSEEAAVAAPPGSARSGHGVPAAGASSAAVGAPAGAAAGGGGGPAAAATGAAAVGATAASVGSSGREWSRAATVAGSAIDAVRQLRLGGDGGTDDALAGPSDVLHPSLLGMSHMSFVGPSASAALVSPVFFGDEAAASGYTPRYAADAGVVHPALAGMGLWIHEVADGTNDAAVLSPVFFVRLLRPPMKRWTARTGARSAAVNEAAVTGGKFVTELLPTDLDADLDAAVKRLLMEENAEAVPAHWHPALGIALPTLQEVGAALQRDGRLAVLNNTKWNSYRARARGPTDASSWIVRPYVLIGPYPEGLAFRSDTRVTARNGAVACLLLAGMGTFVNCMSAEEMRASGVAASAFENEIRYQSRAIRSSLATAVAALKVPYDIAHAIASRAKDYSREQREGLEQKALEAFRTYNKAAKTLENFPAEIHFIYFPVPAAGCAPDAHVAALVSQIEERLRAGQRVYVFSTLGRGRCAVVGATLLGRLYGIDAHLSLEHVQRHCDARLRHVIAPQRARKFVFDAKAPTEALGVRKAAPLARAGGGASMEPAAPAPVEPKKRNVSRFALDNYSGESAVAMKKKEVETARAPPRAASVASSPLSGLVLPPPQYVGISCPEVKVQRDQVVRLLALAEPIYGTIYARAEKGAVDTMTFARGIGVPPLPIQIPSEERAYYDAGTSIASRTVSDGGSAVAMRGRAPPPVDAAGGRDAEGLSLAATDTESVFSFGEGGRDAATEDAGRSEAASVEEDAPGGGEGSVAGSPPAPRAGDGVEPSSREAPADDASVTGSVAAEARPRSPTGGVVRGGLSGQ